MSSTRAVHKITLWLIVQHAANRIYLGLRRYGGPPYTGFALREGGAGSMGNAVALALPLGLEAGLASVLGTALGEDDGVAEAARTGCVFAGAPRTGSETGSQPASARPAVASMPPSATSWLRSSRDPLAAQNGHADSLRRICRWQAGQGERRELLSYIAAVPLRALWSER